MIRRPPRSTRTDTLFPYTTLFRAVTAPVIKGGTCPCFTRRCGTRPAFGPTGGRDGTSEEARHRQGGRDRRERDHRQGTRSRREDARLWRADRRDRKSVG